MIPSGQAVQDTYTEYLIDPNNPTGYSQVLEETTQDYIAGTTTLRTYTLGLDVIAQADDTDMGAAAGETVVFLMTDGHGSTRYLTEDDGDVVAGESYDYDAYGQAIGFIAGVTAGNQTATNLLYTGEMFDATLQMYDLRARYYDPAIGRFPSMDPYAGSMSNPLTLNKYGYCHGDPVNGIDPTGMFTQALGYLAEAAISAVYAKDHRGDIVQYGWWTRLGGPGNKAYRLKPDIFNTTTKKWLEIKPLSPSGLAKAGAQFATYSLLFTPFSYKPDVTWKPSTRLVNAGTMPIIFFNAGGVVFYTDAIDLLEDTLAITSIVLARNFAKQVAPRLASSTLGLIGSKIPSLVTARIQVDNTRLRTHLGIAGMFGMLGVI